MNRRHFVKMAALAALTPTFSYGASPLPADETTPHARWLRVAERLKPKLIESPKTPAQWVRPVADSSRFLRYRMEPAGQIGQMSDRVMRDGDLTIVDFGEHFTGYFAFEVVSDGRIVDSPTRIRLTFGEVPAEVAEPLDRYHGSLSRAWLQDEVINIDVLPATIRLPRRYAFRYVKMEVLAVSPSFSVRLKNPRATAVTSAGPNRHPLPAGTPELLRQIDMVSLNTLRDCMQTVFEDGPKRDQRLWIGDVRLQALANYDTFQNYDLVKRCLYLFAALPREDGFVAACVYEKPTPHYGQLHIIDYAALYVSLLLDYAKATGDWKTARDLWPVARRQMEILSQYIGSDGVFAAPAGSWVFIDWKDGLDRTAAMHGVFVFSLRHAHELALKVGAKAEAETYAKQIERLTASARAAFYDASRRVFTSGPQKQVSWASQAWLALAGIATPEEGAAALRAVIKMPEAVRPGGPYLYHYFVEAMSRCGLQAEAREHLQQYWGSMVKTGADTFWEVYDPAQPTLSPYGDCLINSCCHAWSCTPAYLLRSGGLLSL